MKAGEVIKGSCNRIILPYPNQNWIGGCMFYSRCIDPYFTPYAPLTDRQKGLENPILCPECLSDNTCIHATSLLVGKKKGELHSEEDIIYDSGFYCLDCHLLWSNHQAFCLTCRGYMDYISATQLKCITCGQVWDEDNIISAYENGMENDMLEERSGADSSLEKGDNSDARL